MPAERCGMKALITKYGSVGLTFCFLEGGSYHFGTGYNRDFVNQPELKDGVVYIRRVELEKFGTSEEQGFLYQVTHELGHKTALGRVGREGR